MATQSRYAGNVTQNEEVTYSHHSNGDPKKYRKFANLNNIKTYANYAQSGVNGSKIGGKNGTWPRPSSVLCNHFGFEIPTGAKIIKVTVSYAHQKVGVNGSVPNISGPTLTLTGVSGTHSGVGAAPTTSMKAYEKSASFSPTVAQVNSDNFGVLINYPENKNTNSGYLRLKYVKITVTYTVPSFSATISQKNSSQKKYVGDTMDIEVKLNNLSDTSTNLSCNITLPSIVSYVKKVSGNGSFSNSNRILTWNPGLKSGVNSVSAVFTVKCNSVGSANITLNVLNQGVSSSINKSVLITVNKSVVTVKPPQKVEEPKPKKEEVIVEEVSALSVDFLDAVTEEDSFEFKLVASAPTTTSDTKEYTISFPNICVIESIDGVEVENASLTQTWTPNLTEDDVDVKIFKVYATDHGKFDVSVSYDENVDNVITPVVEHYYVNILPNNLSLPFLTYTILSDEELARMGHNISYTAATRMRINSPNATENTFVDYAKNYRLGIFNDDITDVDFDELEGYDDLEESEKWVKYFVDNAEWSQGFTFEEVGSEEYVERTVDFVYHEGNTVVWIITGEYLEAPNFEETYVDFTMPCIMEHTEDNSKKIDKYYSLPIAIQDIISAGDTYSELTVNERSSTNSWVFDELLTGELETNNKTVIQGVTVTFNVQSSNPITLIAKLVKPGGGFGERSIVVGAINSDDDEIVDSEYTTITLGGEFDLWGFEFEDFTNLEDWMVEVKAVNPYKGDTYIDFNNCNITFHYLNLDDSKVTAKVNGVDARYYGMQITSVSFPKGLQTDTKELSVSGTDTTKVYRMNIKSKEIEIGIRVSGCTIEETSALVKRIAKLFTNSRDSLNQPIESKLEFSHFPDEYWMFINKNGLDVDAEYVDYEGTLKLEIPAGTSYSKNDIVTSTSGVNSGLSKVNPVLLIIPIEGVNEITITESVQNQKFIIRYDGWTGDDRIEIDCRNRTAILHSSRELSDDPDDESDLLTDFENQGGVDISDCVDFNSTWFLINEEYRFESDTCLIDTVSFQERW